MTGDKTTTVYMRPRARLISLIGEELISDEAVALVELVKNSYDADAKNVWIRFEGESTERMNRVVIQDDGHGMDVKTVLEGWLEPGTLLKRKSERSPTGRFYQGAKGIGRFSAARLADELMMETRVKGAPAVIAIFDWGKFDDDSFLDEIKLEYETSNAIDFDHGTRITLEGLRKEWSNVDFTEIHSRLARLTSPFDEVEGFKIHFYAPEFLLSGEVNPPELLLSPIYRLKGNLDSDGKFHGEFLSHGESEIFENKKLPDSDGVPSCGSFEVDLRVWDRDPLDLQLFVDKEFGRNITEIRAILDSFCGVSLYRDGFRVHPYGEKGDDWLNLDHRSRQNPPKHIANNQIVGSIKTSRRMNPSLKDRSTREGLVHNEEYKDFTSWFIRVLNVLELERYDLRPREEKPKERAREVFEQFQLTDTLRFAERNLGKEHALTKQLIKKDKEIRSGVKEVQEMFSRLLMLSGLGHMVDMVIHEFGKPLGKIKYETTIMAKTLEFNLIDTEEQLNLSLGKIDDWVDQLVLLQKRLEPQTPGKRGRATKFNVRTAIEENFILYQALVDKQKVEHKIIMKEQIHAKMSRAAFDQVVTNLLDNALYWVGDKHGHGKGGQVVVSVSPLENGFEVEVCDDGSGVPEGVTEKIFEPYYTRKADGMGLGLHIARLVIEPYGTVVHQGQGALGGACFRAIFERSVGR